MCFFNEFIFCYTCVVHRGVFMDVYRTPVLTRLPHLCSVIRVVSDFQVIYVSNYAIVCTRVNKMYKSVIRRLATPTTWPTILIQNLNKVWSLKSCRIIVQSLYYSCSINSSNALFHYIYLFNALIQTIKFEKKHTHLNPKIKCFILSVLTACTICNFTCTIEYLAGSTFRQNRSLKQFTKYTVY